MLSGVLLFGKIDEQASCAATSVERPIDKATSDQASSPFPNCRRLRRALEIGFTSRKRATLRPSEFVSRSTTGFRPNARLTNFRESDNFRGWVNRATRAQTEKLYLSQERYGRRSERFHRARTRGDFRGRKQIFASYDRFRRRNFRSNSCERLA